MARHPAPTINLSTSKSVNLLLINEIIRYSAKSTSNDPQKASELLREIGFPVGYRSVDRLILYETPFTEQLEVLKFLCKDLWIFFFQKQADRLQTDRRGVYIIYENNLPWLKHHLPEPQYTQPTLTSFESVQSISNICKSPSVYTTFICGLLQGALSNLGLSCVVTSEELLPPACLFKIFVSV